MTEVKLKRCDCCKQIIDTDFGALHLRFVSENSRPIYQDVITESYDFDMCAECASDFGRKWVSFLEYQKKQLWKGDSE